MNAWELVQELQKLPENTEIFLLDGYHAELNDIERVGPWAENNPRDRDHGKIVIWAGGPV